MARRVILLSTLGLLIALAGAPGYRWLRARLARDLPIYSRLPDFELRDAAGRAFARERLRGKVWVADFIYTRCEDACPLQTAEMRRLQQAFSGEGDFRQISITVDPAHDTGARLAAYARKYGAERSRWFFLTGEEGAIRELALKGFRLSYATKKAALPDKSPGGWILRLALPRARAHHPGHGEGKDAPGVLISHSSRFVLIDRRFNVRGYYHSDDPASLEKLRRDLRMVLGE